MLERLHSIVDKFVHWQMWWSIKRRIRPFEETSQFLQPYHVPIQLRLILDSLRTGQYAGIVLLTDNKRIQTYVTKTLRKNKIRTAIVCLPYHCHSFPRIFGEVKKIAAVLDVDYAVDGYENKTPFYVYRIPNDRRRTTKNDRGRNRTKSSRKELS